MKLEFEKMTIKDLDNIKDNLESDFDDFWNYNILKSELENDLSYFIVCKYNEEIIGFAGFKKVLDEADIMNIVIKKQYQNKKIGTALFNQLIILAKSLNINILNLEVNENNIYAIKLYKKFDFKEVGKRKFYYNNNDTAILMKKQLEK